MRDKKRKVNRKKCRKILAWKKWVAAAAALTLLVGTGTSFTYAQQPAGYETADGAAGEGSARLQSLVQLKLRHRSPRSDITALIKDLSCICKGDGIHKVADISFRIDQRNTNNTI